MKKVYVKARPKNVKKSPAKAYIIAVSLSAILCAAVFSLILKPGDELTKDIKIEIEDASPEEIAQVSEPLEIEVPITKEIEETPKVEVVEPQTESEKTQSVQTGGFTAEEVKFMMPVTGEIINDYSSSRPVKSKTTGEWRTHNGIDIKAPSGENVKAPSDGKVIISENNKLTGNAISIEHKDGFVSTLYNLGSISVSAGSKVSAGDVVGTVGNSALLENSDEAHVHFELKKDKKIVNPKEYIK